MCDYCFYEVLLNKRKIKDTPCLRVSPVALTILDINTTKYLDANIKSRNILKQDRLFEMDSYDTLAEGKKNKLDLDNYYKDARRYGKVAPYTKNAIDGEGNKISYKIKTTVFNNLLVCTARVVPSEIEKRTNNIVFFLGSGKLISGNRNIN